MHIREIRTWIRSNLYNNSYPINGGISMKRYDIQDIEYDYQMEPVAIRTTGFSVGETIVVGDVDQAFINVYDIALSLTMWETDAVVNNRLLASYLSRTGKNTVTVEVLMDGSGIGDACPLHVGVIGEHLNYKGEEFFLSYSNIMLSGTSNRSKKQLTLVVPV